MMFLPGSTTSAVLTGLVKDCFLKNMISYSFQGIIKEKELGKSYSVCFHSVQFKICAQSEFLSD